jgi:ferrous iron transport protein A
MKLKFAGRWHHHQHQHPHHIFHGSQDRISLSEMDPGESGVVVALIGGHCLVSRMLALGLSPGAEVTVIQNFGHGPLIASVRDTRIALGRGEARKIILAEKLV